MTSLKRFFKTLLNRLNFRKKLLTFYILLSVIPILFTALFIYWSYSRVLLENTRTSTQDTINLVCDEIEELFNSALSMCTMVSDDINMQKFLRRQFGTLAEQYSCDLEGSMELASISAYRSDLFGVYVLGANGGRYKSNSYSFKVEDQRETGWYGSIIQSTGPVWFVPHEESFVVKCSLADHFISVGIPVIDKASGRKSGVVVADIDENVIISKIRYGITNGSILILDETGSVIFQSSNEDEPSGGAALTKEAEEKLAGWQAEATSTVVPDDNHLIICRRLGQTQWKIAGVVDKNLLIQTNQSIAYSVMLVLLLVTIMAVFTAAFVSESVSRPVRQLVYLMEKVEAGDLTVRAPDLGDNELGILGKSFNQMVSQTQVLIHQIYEGQKKLRSSELKALQSQIQPHFLYNCLDSITWLLRLGKTEDAQQMLAALSSLFRISLSKGKEIITIGDEIQHVTNYLLIQNIIYSKKFSYQVSCDTSLYGYKTLKLLLQPLVENCISHARPRKGEKVHIEVSVWEEKDCLVLSVRDYSMGLTPEQLRALQKKLEYPDFQDSLKHGYGLYNVNERIHILLGRNYGLHVKSVENYGTLVSIRIPKVKGDEEFVSGNFM